MPEKVETYYLLCVYIPCDHTEQVLKSLFEAGAGTMGNYSDCAWIYPGIGQFKALKGADPAVGEQDTLTKVEEDKVEVICREDLKEAVKKALMSSHPYEMPAYHFIKIEI